MLEFPTGNNICESTCSPSIKVLTVKINKNRQDQQIGYAIWISKIKTISSYKKGLTLLSSAFHPVQQPQKRFCISIYHYAEPCKVTLYMYTFRVGIVLHFILPICTTTPTLKVTLCNRWKIILLQCGFKGGGGSAISSTNMQNLMVLDVWCCICRTHGAELWFCALVLQFCILYMQNHAKSH